MSPVLKMFLGEMEATMVRTMARTANIRHWLHPSDCPEAVRFLKGLFDRCFVPIHGTDNADEFVQRKGTCRAYVAYDGGNLSPVKMHEGNSTIIYRPSPSSPPVAFKILSTRSTKRCSCRDNGLLLGYQSLVVSKVRDREGG